MSRKIWSSLAACAVTGGFIATSFLVAPTATADPQAVAQAQAALDAISEKASSIESDYIAAQAKLDDANKALKAAEADLTTETGKVNASKQELALMARARFQSSSIDITTRLLSSPDDSTFLSQLATLQSVRTRNNDRLQNFQVQQAKVTQLSDAARAARDEIASETAKLKKLNDEYQAKEKEATDTLKRLTAEEKKRLADLQAQQAAAQAAALVAPAQAGAPARGDVVSRSDDRTAGQAQQTNTKTPAASDKSTPAPAASGRASTAVAWALAQVGKNYRMGGTGPSSFDCSGLMLRAWQAAGVSLPRTSQMQFNVGRSVSASELQPGDLVFYYSGISHVGMYIGGGKIVHAANPRSGVKISSVFSMPFMGARRVG